MTGQRAHAVPEPPPTGWWWWFMPERRMRKWRKWRDAQPVDQTLFTRHRQEDAKFGLFIEARERAILPCVMCECGEPHACVRAWWQQQCDHLDGRCCADLECTCWLAADLERQAAEIRPVSWLLGTLR